MIRETATDAARALSQTTLKAARLARSLLTSPEPCSTCHVRRATTVSRGADGRLHVACKPCSDDARVGRQVKAQQIWRNRIRHSHV